MSKIQNIQALRGIAVLSVVLFHLTAIEQKYGGSKTILPDIFDFGMFGVDLFFVISGFVMVVVTREKFQNIKQALRFLYHRVSRIYPIYWFYSLLVLGVFIIKPTMVNSGQGNQVDLLASFLLLPSETLPLVMVGWTLIHEMYFYLIFFVVLLLTPEKRFSIALLIWASGIVGLNIYLEALNPLTQLLVNPLTIEFISGCFIAILFNRKPKPILTTRLSLIIVLAGLAASMYGHHYYQTIAGNDPQGWWRVLIYGTTALLMVFCIIDTERNGYVIHSSLIKIGDASYSIYLSHVLTLSAAGRVWSVFSTDSIYDNLIMAPVLLALTIIAGIVSYRYIEKPLLVLSRRIA